MPYLDFDDINGFGDIDDTPSYLRGLNSEERLVYRRSYNDAGIREERSDAECHAIARRAVQALRDRFAGTS
ncbi:hypothetical protein KGQ71_02165 [Patescibacteria group bacterium]|nr:hypothetical protein [Patescibacteria group bacterium]